jgi:hypothetical protein
MGMLTSTTIMENTMVFPQRKKKSQKAEVEFQYDGAMALLVMWLKNVKSLNLHSHVHCSMTDKKQPVKTMCLLNKWIKKM